MSWIKVEDKLPEYHNAVIVTDGFSSHEAYLSSSGRWVRNEYCLDLVKYNVIAWQPMPQWEVK